MAIFHSYVSLPEGNPQLCLLHCPSEGPKDHCHAVPVLSLDPFNQSLNCAVTIAIWETQKCSFKMFQIKIETPCGGLFNSCLFPILTHNIDLCISICKGCSKYPQYIIKRWEINVKSMEDIPANRQTMLMTDFPDII